MSSLPSISIHGSEKSEIGQAGRMTVLLLVDVYGETLYVRAADYEKAKHAIRMTTRDGTYLDERVSQRTGLFMRRKPGLATMIARENIAYVAETRSFEV